MVVRARAVKAQLSDVEGLEFKLEEKQRDIQELKMALRRKAEELSEGGVKVGLLEKRVETADAECSRKVEEERAEASRIRAAMVEEKRWVRWGGVGCGWRERTCL